MREILDFCVLNLGSWELIVFPIGERTFFIEKNLYFGGRRFINNDLKAGSDLFSERIKRMDSS